MFVYDCVYDKRMCFILVDIYELRKTKTEKCRKRPFERSRHVSVVGTRKRDDTS